MGDKYLGSVFKNKEMQHMTREERKEAYRLVEEDFIQNEDRFRNIKEYEPGKGINLPLSSHG